MAENEIPQNPTTEAERVAALAAYKPEEHLTEWEKGGQIILYYPAAWRLYELGLRFPDARFEETQIIEIDKERNFALLRSKVFIGESWENASRRGSGLKQCTLSNIDKAETAAMARAARNFGISPTLGLDMDDESIGQIVKKTEDEKQSKSANGRKREQENRVRPAARQNQQPASAGAGREERRQAQTATRPETRDNQSQTQEAAAGPLEKRRETVRQMAKKLGLKTPPLEKLDAVGLADLISQYKQENAQRQATARQEAAARAEMEAAKK